jgi:hypothetical protein
VTDINSQSPLPQHVKQHPFDTQIPIQISPWSTLRISQPPLNPLIHFISITFKMLLRKDSNGEASHSFSEPSSTTQSHNVAWIGLGAMGLGMASHLVKNGFNVTGYDIYEPSLAKFRENRGSTATSPLEAARNAEFLVCMVASSAQAQHVLFDKDTGAVQGMEMCENF